MSEQFSSTPGPAAAGRIEIASGFDGIDAGAAPPISAAGPNGRGPTYGYGSNVIGDGEVHLLDYVKVLYKRRWTAITAFLVVFLSVTIYTFTATPIYEAKVQILIEKENTNVVTFKEAFEQNQIADELRLPAELLPGVLAGRGATHLLQQPALDPIQHLLLPMLAELDFHLPPGHRGSLRTHGPRAHVVVDQFRE